MAKGKTREKIVKAAIKVFSENGYERAHVEDILKEAGVCKGTFYRYFRSKSDLLERAYQDFLFNVGGEWYEFINNTDDPIKGIEYHVDFIFSVICEEKTAATFFELWARGVRSEAGKQSSTGEKTKLPGTDVYRMLRENIARFYRLGRERGLIEFDFDPELMASFLVATVDGFSTQFMLDPGSLDVLKMRDLIKQKCVYDQLTPSARENLASAQNA